MYLKMQEAAVNRGVPLNVLEHARINNPELYNFLTLIPIHPPEVIPIIQLLENPSQPLGLMTDEDIEKYATTMIHLTKEEVSELITKFNLPLKVHNLYGLLYSDAKQLLKYGGYDFMPDIDEWLKLYSNKKHYQVELEDDEKKSEYNFNTLILETGDIPPTPVFGITKLIVKHFYVAEIEELLRLINDNKDLEELQIEFSIYEEYDYSRKRLDQAISNLKHLKRLTYTPESDVVFEELQYLDTNNISKILAYKD